MEICHFEHPIQHLEMLFMVTCGLVRMAETKFILDFVLM